jgi:prolipoprotein diacylglyceryltransferase
LSHGLRLIMVLLFYSYVIVLAKQVDFLPAVGLVVPSRTPVGQLLGRCGQFVDDTPH